MNSGQAIPRELIKWLDSLDLTYSVKNVRRDLATGFTAAEIVSRYYPSELNVYNIDNGLKFDKRKDNWEQISKLLLKKEFILEKSEYEQIYNQAPNAAHRFLCRLYEFFTKKKLNLDKLEKLPKINVKQEVPSYAKPTNCQLAKDKELVRIIDEDEKKFRTL